GPGGGGRGVRPRRGRSRDGRRDPARGDQPHADGDRVRELRAQPGAGDPARPDRYDLSLGARSRSLRLLRRLPSRAAGHPRGEVSAAMLETLLIVWRGALGGALIVGLPLTFPGRRGPRAGAGYVLGGSAGGPPSAA